MLSEPCLLAATFARDELLLKMAFWINCNCTLKTPVVSQLNWIDGHTRPISSAAEKGRT